MNDASVYVGKDLEAMAFAENYHRWIIDEFRPFIGKRIVEVGAGTGDFSRLLAGEKRHEWMGLVEPSEMFEHLATADGLRDDPAIEMHRSVFTNVAEKLAAKGPDTIVYVNVLEHIEDDAAELEAVRSTLVPGGRCLIFVPAMSALYGPFDRRIGHFRRYGRKELVQKCTMAGFSIEHARYFDLFGVLPWLVKYRILGSDSLEPGSVRAYDRLVVPVARRLERMLRPPFGKNLLVIARKR